MSIRSMIDAARAGNAVEFEKHFVNETQERLSAALTARRAQVVGNMFGLSENEDEDCDDDDMKKDKKPDAETEDED